MGVRERARAVGVQEPDLVCPARGDLSMQRTEPFEYVGIGQVPVASVEVVVAAHRFGRHVQVGPIRMDPSQARAANDHTFGCESSASTWRADP